MLADARQRARETEDAPVEFLEADAQTHDFEAGGFDLVFSRFGVMFFEDPVAAFANLRRALAPSGRLAFLCWQSIVDNPWMLLPAQAVAEHVSLPAPAAPDAPGPFAFADADRVRGLLEGAGFADVDVAAHEGELAVGRGLELDEIVDFLQQMGPAGAALRESSETVREAATRSMRAALEPHYRDDAVVLSFACWIVQGRP
jgi:SAM-dependent methyltransferase